MEFNQIPSTTTLYNYFFKLVSFTGIYSYQFNNNASKQGQQLKIIRHGWMYNWYKFTAIYLAIYTTIQYALLLYSIGKGQEVMLIVIQSGWVYGTSYGTTAMLHRVLAAESLSTLQQEFIRIQQLYLEKSPKFCTAWKHQLIVFTSVAFFCGWVGSTFGICIFFFTFPTYPQQLYGYTLAVDNNESIIDRTSLKCLLFGLYETFMMIPAWGNVFTTYVSHHAIHSGLAYALQANSFDAYLEEALKLKGLHGLDDDGDDEKVVVNDEDFLQSRLNTALQLNRAIYRFYKKYNESCAGFHLIFMTFAMFLSWACLYSILAFYNRLNPFMMLIFILNTISTIAYILCHSNQASLELRVRSFLDSWKQGPGRLPKQSEDRKYYQQQLRSHPPIYYAYAGICRMEPSTVLELLYHFTNHVTVFLRL